MFITNSHAGYAEIGDFDAAVRYEEKALSIKGAETAEVKRLEKHLDLFKQHKPPQ